jgi:lambda repressor-like predicted transcriptional regulator
MTRPPPHRQALAEVVQRSMTVRGVTASHLAERSGLSEQTLKHVLNAEHDCELSSFLAVADSLGLDLFLVPRTACATVHSLPFEPTEPVVLTRVQAALSAVRARL